MHELDLEKRREPGEVTVLLKAWGEGGGRASDGLWPLVYGELRKIAAGLLARERPWHELQPTALVNETYLKLAGQRVMRWENRGHFFGIATRIMRRILIDHARGLRAGRHGRGLCHLALADVRLPAPERPSHLAELDRALRRLRRLDPGLAAIVDARTFDGATVGEIADSLGVSMATVQRRWRLARAWLWRELGDGREPFVDDG